MATTRDRLKALEARVNAIALGKPSDDEVLDDLASRLTALAESIGEEGGIADPTRVSVAALLVVVLCGTGTPQDHAELQRRCGDDERLAAIVERLEVTSDDDRSTTAARA